MAGFYKVPSQLQGTWQKPAMILTLTMDLWSSWAVHTFVLLNIQFVSKYGLLA